LRDQQKIAEQAANLEKKYAGRPLAESARDALSVALEMQGRHDEAKKIIERLASSAKTPGAQKRAAALLQSPEYNLLATFQEARSERRVESVKYVLLGEDLLKKNLIYAAGAVAAAGPAGAVTLGAANAMMVGNNLINVLSNNPVSAQSVIDAGVAYVRNHPGSDSATEVYKILADTYEEKGMIDKAIGYHELAGTPKEKLSSLKQKAATALLNAATKSKGRGTQEYYLTTLIDQYPESPAAAEATKKLAELAKTDNHGLRMSKQFLKENPELFGPAGLGLKATLFDGNPRNMELADRGVNVTGGNELLIYYQTASGVRSQSYPLPRQTSERFFVTLRQKNHAVAMADAGQRAKGSVGGIKNLPMPIFQGARPNAGEPEQERDDTTFSFVREASAHAPAFPKVLDHEMLSENERNPGGKYSLPPIQGSVSASRFSMSGALPAGLWGNQIGIGGDHKGSFAGVQLPIPLLEGFMPVDFMVQGRPGGVSVYPRIHMRDDKGEDRELYK
jgi:tetratricopeptide (TPR) repeat protein